MMCPAGHDSAADDYCDVCGVAMPTAPAGPAVSAVPDAAAAAQAAAAADCPNCQAANSADALFCEACGYDFTTGSMPRRAEPIQAPPTVADAGNISPPLAAAWVAEIWIDPDWYADQASTDQLPSPGLPQVIALRHTSILIGRASVSRNISPDIDLSSDTGISRRHAQLTTDGSRWWVEDLGSSNGTYVGGALDALPKTPVAPGHKQEVRTGDRIYLGAWSRLIVRKAAPGEV